MAHTAKGKVLTDNGRQAAQLEDRADIASAEKLAKALRATIDRTVDDIKRGKTQPRAALTTIMLRAIRLGRQMEIEINIAARQSRLAVVRGDG